MEASIKGAVTPVDVATLCEWLHVQPDDICFAFVYLPKLRSSLPLSAHHSASLQVWLAPLWHRAARLR